MPDLHVSDELLDQYALDKLPEERLAGVEEHLLVCQACQSRLEVSDEFAMLFRAAATQPDVRSRRSWIPRWNHRAAGWTAGAAAVLAAVLFVVRPFPTTPMAPVTVLMQSLRGPDGGEQIIAGRPALLVFDVAPAAGVGAYQARIVNPVGVEMLSAKVSQKDGRLSVLIDRLPRGSYWVRLFRSDNPEPIAEYGLQTR